MELVNRHLESNTRRHNKLITIVSRRSHGFHWGHVQTIQENKGGHLMSRSEQIYDLFPPIQGWLSPIIQSCQLVIWNPEREKTAYKDTAIVELYANIIAWILIKSVHITLEHEVEIATSKNWISRTESNQGPATCAWDLLWPIKNS